MHCNLVRLRGDEYADMESVFVTGQGQGVGVGWEGGRVGFAVGLESVV